MMPSLERDGCHGLFRGSRAEEFRAWLRGCFARFIARGDDLISKEIATPLAPIDPVEANEMLESAEAAGWIRRGAYEPSPARLRLGAFVPRRRRASKGLVRHAVDFMWTPNLRSEAALRTVGGEQ